MFSFLNFYAKVGVKSPVLDAVLIFPIAIVPSIILCAIVDYVAKINGMNVKELWPPSQSFSFLQLLNMVVASPLIETFLLGALIRFLAKFLSNNYAIAAISALSWGLLHALLAPLWFFGTVWSFFVFSLMYLKWLTRSSRDAFKAAAAAHVLVNLCAILVAAAGLS